MNTARFHRPNMLAQACTACYSATVVASPTRKEHSHVPSPRRRRRHYGFIAVPMHPIMQLREMVGAWQTALNVCCAEFVVLSLLCWMWHVACGESCSCDRWLAVSKASSAAPSPPSAELCSSPTAARFSFASRISCTHCAAARESDQTASLFARRFAHPAARPPEQAAAGNSTPSRRSGRQSPTR